MRGDRRVRVIIPATTANLGPGFDVLGMALTLYNEVTLETAGGLKAAPTKDKDLEVVVRGEGENSLPRNRSNIVWRAAATVFARARRWPARVRLTLVNRIPLARGLGSSAAARVGGILAAAKVCGGESPDGALSLAVQLEGHPDNVAPAILGGLVASVSVPGGVVRTLSVPVPSGLHAVVCVPSFELSTERARRALPRSVPLADAVFTSSRVAMLVTALAQKRWDLLGIGMEDRLHQPYRAKLVPGLDRVMDAARRAGALGASLSGAGPSILALVRGEGVVARRVGAAMVRAFAPRRGRSHALVLGIDRRGTRVRAA